MANSTEHPNDKAEKLPPKAAEETTTSVCTSSDDKEKDLFLKFVDIVDDIRGVKHQQENSDHEWKKNEQKHQNQQKPSNDGIDEDWIELSNFEACCCSGVEGSGEKTG